MKKEKSGRSTTIDFTIENSSLTWEQIKEELTKKGVKADHKWFLHTRQLLDKYIPPKNDFGKITNIMAEIYIPGMSKEKMYEKLKERGITPNTCKDTTIQRTFDFLKQIHNKYLDFGFEIKKN